MNDWNQEEGMGTRLEILIERARSIRMSPTQREEQRRSFAYGTAKIENDNITRETVKRAAESLARRSHNQRDR